MDFNEYKAIPMEVNEDNKKVLELKRICPRKRVKYFFSQGDTQFINEK